MLCLHMVVAHTFNTLLCCLVSQSIGPVAGQSSPAVMDAVCLRNGCVTASTTVEILVMRTDVVRYQNKPIIQIQ